MAKTNAERQAAYRSKRDERNNGDGERRLNAWITSAADLALDRLARRYAVKRRQMMERLICDADNVILKSLDCNNPEWDNYFMRGVTQ
jgi:hypothetical protein